MEVGVIDWKRIAIFCLDLERERRGVFYLEEVKCIVKLWKRKRERKDK